MIQTQFKRMRNSLVTQYQFLQPADFTKFISRLDQKLFSGYDSADGDNETKPKRRYGICDCLPKRIIIIDLLYMLPTFDTGVGNLGMTIILRPSNLSTTNNGGCHQLVLINQIRIF